MGQRSRLLLPALVLTVLVATPAAGGLFGRRDPEPEPVDTDPPEPVGPPPLEVSPPLFDGTLPVELGPLPTGLANLSAQGCNSCHWQAHDGWSATAHAGAPGDALRTAARDAGSPECLTCHLPAQRQHATVWAHDGGAMDTLIEGPNPAFDATLATEGVTCAACHVRDGHVVGASAHSTAPHPGRQSPQLAGAEACAGCHQMAWAGADKPLYDTVGEWQRSAWAEAGITCVDCHMRRDSDGPVTHDVRQPPERAISVLVDLPADPVVRGGDEVPVRITLQNTGAGHAFPTGSPFQGVRLMVDVEGPAERGEERTTWGTGLTSDLQRTLEDAPPWNTTADSRLQAGEQRTMEHLVALDVKAPRGAYVLRVRLVRTVRGEVVGDPFIERRVPMRVE